MVREYIENIYKIGEPIFLSDIRIDGMTDENLRYHFKRLTEEEFLCRFDTGVYYRPKKSILGGFQPLSIEKVMECKYILRQGKRVGYYAGNTLMNQMGLSAQVPYVGEIISNLAPATVRRIQIKGREYVIRKSQTEVTDENVFILQGLECLKNLDDCSEESPEKSGKILREYFHRYGITKERMDAYIGRFPLKVYKAIYETGVTGDVSA